MTRYVAYAQLTSIVILGCADYGAAFPPLGLTHVGQVSGGNLEIIDGSAYLPTCGSISRVDSEGTVTVFELVHPELGSPSSLTRVVEAHDGELYVGANFRAPDPSVSAVTGAALFSLDEPADPIVTWHGDEHPEPFIVGIDRSLRGLGNLVVFSEVSLSPELSAAEFHLDGTVEFLERPPGADPASVFRVSPSGYALGEASVPATLGSGVVLWTPGGSFSFISEAGIADSLRDRLDGQGVNIGYNPGGPIIIYGEEAVSFLNVPGDPHVIVSQSDFALVGNSRVGQTEDYFAFFPGIVPEDPAQAVPLFDVFPELASVNFDRITDLAAVDGRIYMTLRGDDGLYLFGARDPSVIPEPPTLVLGVLVAGAGGGLARSRLNRTRGMDIQAA